MRHMWMAIVMLAIGCGGGVQEVTQLSQLEGCESLGEMRERGPDYTYARQNLLAYAERYGATAVSRIVHQGCPDMCWVSAVGYRC